MMPTMTPEEFLAHIEQGKPCYRDKGKSRINRARRWYAAYCRVYKSESIYDLVMQCFVAGFAEHQPMRIAARERDEGKPMIIVLEFMGPGDQ